ncbi:helix-turn-helix transcriptional regulator [Phaeocystidibacter marisrubri]|uniref:Helix-turn-helix domain-containing protein n=1 Tax=Phaeocystidibacter marisrubri TaxID=1577780 RepID=A0A6L3ZDB6_9FLAO|nr:helix-turn-helix domain-containing protein [Phaeocystidibacter marisrubri]KAB2815636.1 helix-turn-helix domain-containing protein [Phaeocystidibacter marisrubri]GGH64922.1 hypothetical protein GCM10011318_01410 [Phaeocystidibacter marisrubri]
MSFPEIHKIRGVHPGAILKRELKSRSIRSSQLAAQIGEHKQTISAIINQRRAINPVLSIKLGKVFQIESDYFQMIQASYDTAVAKSKLSLDKPNLSVFREALFWDTSIDKIDWIEHKRFVIQRILERGNTEEILAMISFYGKSTIVEEIKQMGSSRLKAFEKNILEFELD